MKPLPLRITARLLRWLEQLDERSAYAQTGRCLSRLTRPGGYTLSVVPMTVAG